MAIRPIDVQIVVHRAAEVSRHNADSQQAGQAQANQFAQEFKKEVQNQGQQVNNPNSAEKAEVDKDGRGGAANSNKRDKQKDPKDSDKDSKDSGKPLFKNEQGRFSAKI
ncbi:MAG: hypothetical protein FWE20_06985 [Defluviitaleaceae bacterium]|nr:hypothetical protein [Defluviitaleaceae bacterium]